MKIVFSPHALKRIRERGIGKSIVLQTIQNPEDVKIDPFKGKIFVRGFGERELNVPVVEEKGIIIVKSVFFK